MIRIARAELLKIRTTWAWWVLLLISVGLTTLIAGVTAWATTTQQSAATGAPGLDTVAGLRNVYAQAGQGYVFTLILGILGMTTEYRHMTITPSFLAVPRRGQVVLAKMIAHAIAGFGFAVLTIGTALAGAILVITLLGYDFILPGLDLPLILGGGLVATTLYAIFGLGVGALIRNQVAAIVGALVWMFVAEALLIALLPEVGKWLPGGASGAVLRASMNGGQLLPAWAGGLVFVGYSLAFALAGTLLTVRRDIT